MRKLFPLSYPKKGVGVSFVGYLVIYLLASLIKGILVYFGGEGTPVGLAGGIFALVATVYIFIGLMLLCFDFLKLHKK